MAAQGTQGAETLGKHLTLINISLLSLMIAIKGHQSWSPDKTFVSTNWKVLQFTHIHSVFSLILKWRFE